MPVRSLFGVSLTVAIFLPSAGQADEKLDYAELSRLIHQGVVAQVPRQVEDRAEWGKTVPITSDVRFPRLARVKVKVGDREEYPHGLWKKTKVWMDDPAKDVQIQVRDFKVGERGTFQLGIDVTAAVHGEHEWKPWQKGFALPGLTVQADAKVFLALECEVGVTFDFTKLPPDVKVQPKVLKPRVDLQEFDLLRLGNKIITVEGDRVRDLGIELKDVLQTYIRSQEAEVQRQLNQALEKSVKDGKGSFSGANLMKMLNPEKSK
jgi:hypothetical protein